MKHLYLLLLFFAAAWSAEAQHTNNQNYEDRLSAIVTQCNRYQTAENYDSLLSLARYGLSVSATSDFPHRSIFHYQCGYVISASNVPEGIYHLRQALWYGRKAQDKKLIVQALDKLLFIYSNTSGYIRQRDDIFKQALDIIKSETSDTFKSGLYTAIADYYSITCNYEAQIQYLIKSLEWGDQKFKSLQASNDDTVSYGVGLMNIGGAYLRTNNPAKGIEYIHKARPYLDNYQAGITHYYKSLCDAYVLKGKLGNAFVYYDSLQIFLTRSKAKGSAWGNKISNDLTIADYCKEQGKMDSALLFINRALATAKKYPQDEFTLSQVDYMAGVVLFEKKQYDRALSYLKAAEPFARDWTAEIYAGVLKSIADCYAAMNLWQQATNYYQMYLPLRDSLYQSASSQSFADAEARYQNNAKQQQIATKDLQLSYAARQRYGLIGGLLLLSIVVLLLVAIYRNKKRSAEALNTKNGQLEKLNIQLDEANRTKAKMFGILSHDLRAPISQVYQFLSIQQSKSGRLTPEQQEAFSRQTQSATAALLQTMEDLLLWSKSQMDMFTVQKGNHHILPIIQNVIALLHLGAEAKSLQLNTHICASGSVFSDEYYLQTIITNLLQNAIKSAPPYSEINIRFHALPAVSIISISNTGPAFSQQAYDAIMNSADQQPLSLSGLGLRLVRELAEKTGLQIQFSNPSENQTTVKVVIPAAKGISAATGLAH